VTLGVSELKEFFLKEDVINIVAFVISHIRISFHFFSRLIIMVIPFLVVSYERK